MDFKPALKTVVFALIGGSFTLAALAQWQWTDKDGRKVFSDRAPPADILDKNILKRPLGNTQARTASASQSTGAVPSPSAAASAALHNGSAPTLSGKDAQLEAKKKQADEEDAAKKRAEEEKLAKSKAENCERAKKGLAGFQSGLRVFVTNAKGEREVMDDNARAAETRRLQGIAASDCK